MSQLLNLIVELDGEFTIAWQPGIQIAGPAPADEQTLAWIDEVFGGAWSSEAYAGTSIVARRAGKPVGFATFDPHGMNYAWLQGVAREPGVGIFGPVGVTPDERAQGLGALLLRLALNALRERGYSRALIPAVGDEGLVKFYVDAVGARVAERFERASLFRPARRVLVMASGNGSNFQAVIDAVRDGRLPIDVVALFSNNLHARVLVRARDGGIPSHAVVWNRDRASRDEYDERLLAAATAEEPDLVLLLGWMHLLSDAFVHAFPQLLNLHPAFLPLDPARDAVGLPDGTQMPAFRGSRAVRDALAASSRWVGATLHRVTTSTDRGPVMTRKPLRVEPGEEEGHLTERVHDIEHGIVRSGTMRWLYER
ncbi:MAG: GNAT family N-acetyltransferase [Candidatus Cybelea sp.]